MSACVHLFELARVRSVDFLCFRIHKNSIKTELDEVEAERRQIFTLSDLVELIEIIIISDSVGVYALREISAGELVCVCCKAPYTLTARSPVLYQ